MAGESGRYSVKHLVVWIEVTSGGGFSYIVSHKGDHKWGSFDPNYNIDWMRRYGLGGADLNLLLACLKSEVFLERPPGLTYTYHLNCGLVIGAKPIQGLRFKCSDFSTAFEADLEYDEVRSLYCNIMAVMADLTGVL